MRNFTVIKLIMYITLQRGYHRRYFGFQNAFPNGKLDRLVCVEFSKAMFGDKLYWGNVMRLRRTLGGLKDAACICYDLLNSQFDEAGLIQLPSALCVFKFKSTIHTCYVDDLLVFPKHE